MEERERRLGLNEAMFREVNERVEDMNKTFSSVTGTFDIFCECGDTSCTERITVPTGVYEETRAKPTHFLLRTGHEVPTVENVIVSYDSYVIVEKEGEVVERVVEQTDPRADE